MADLVKTVAKLRSGARPQKVAEEDPVAVRAKQFIRAQKAFKAGKITAVQFQAIYSKLVK